MALHFQPMVNGHPIGSTVVITRVTPEERPGPDTVGVYRAEIHEPARHRVAHVEHRYGDGAIELIRLALNVIHEQETP